MKKLLLFTDGSAHPPTGIGYGAYLAISLPGEEDGELPKEDQIKSKIKVRRFENTTPSHLELQTTLWALNEIGSSDVKIFIYTDSQTIVNLKNRRERLEKNSFRSLTNKPLKNASLYRQFFNLTDSLNIEFVKIKGHRSAKDRKKLDNLFRWVDKTARKALREDAHVRKSGEGEMRT